MAIVTHMLPQASHANGQNKGSPSISTLPAMATAGVHVLE